MVTQLWRHQQTDGPILCAPNFREGECSCRAEKLKLPAYSFRSQYRLGWNLALPEEDCSNHRQTDGTILCARNFREGECSRRAAKLSCPLMRSARNIGSGGTSPSRKKTVPAPFLTYALPQAYRFSTACSMAIVDAISLI
jgi:hypothetical protein